MLRIHHSRQNSQFCRGFANHVKSATQPARCRALFKGPFQQRAAHSTRHDGPLAGKTVAVKDNIVTRDHPTTAASLALANYQSPFDATVVRLLRENGAEVTGGMNMDEFGMGSHSQHSHSGGVQSPFSRGGRHLSPGGSSGGSAVAVATGEYWAALGTDTGGSVRLPAAYTGVIGFKPSYGLLSRWGVIQYANSLDTVGILARRVSTVRSVFTSINRFDALDPTSHPPSVRSRIASNPPERPQSLRIGIPVDYNIAESSTPVRETWISLLGALQTAGHSLHPVALPNTRVALPAYYIIAPAEASSNLAKYDGIRYGYRAEPELAASDSPSTSPSPSSSSLYASTRGAALGEEVQRRILVGAYSLSADKKDNYFLQAQRIRRLVQWDFDSVFALANPLLDADKQCPLNAVPDANAVKVDVLIAPTAPTLPPTIDEVKNWTPEESHMNDVFTVPASLAGLPAISVPVPLGPAERKGMEETDVKSVGMQIIGQFGDDDLVLDCAEMLEGLIGP